MHLLNNVRMKLRISGLGAHSTATWLRTQGCARPMNSRRKRAVASTTPYVTTRTPSGISKLSLHHLSSKVCKTLHNLLFTSPTNSFLRCFVEFEDHIISYHIISYHIISYHIISYHIISYHIISYHIISYH